MKRALVVFLLLAAALSLHAQITTVVIVRHGEKVDESSNSALSDSGKVRAGELARVLAGENVKAIIVSQFVRSQQTAAPLAAAQHLQPVTIKTSDHYARDVASEVKKHAGGSVVVVSHSDRIGPIMKELGIAAPPSIEKHQYDDLFVVTLTGGKAKLTSLRYGDVAR